MIQQLNLQRLILWSLGLLFCVIGLMNLVLIHPVPGLFYMLFASIYLPPIGDMVRSKMGFSIPFRAKFLIAVLLIWATLGVGDLAELYDL